MRPSGLCPVSDAGFRHLLKLVFVHKHQALLAAAVSDNAQTPDHQLRGAHTPEQGGNTTLASARMSFMLKEFLLVLRHNFQLLELQRGSRDGCGGAEVVCAELQAAQN